jgi:hypothetical protein
MARADYGSIMLHPTLGINPHLTFCQRCGGDAEDVLMLGIKNYVDKCASCGCEHYGGSDKQGECMRCGSHNLQRRTIGDTEKLPVPACAKCREMIEACNKAVEDGGVFWKCAGCGSEGAVVKDSELAIAARNYSGIEAPDPVGIEVNDCPLCRPKEEIEGATVVDIGG